MERQKCDECNDEGMQLRWDTECDDLGDCHDYSFEVTCEYCHGTKELPLEGERWCYDCEAWRVYEVIRESSQATFTKQRIQFDVNTTEYKFDCGHEGIKTTVNHNFSLYTSPYR